MFLNASNSLSWNSDYHITFSSFSIWILLGSALNSPNRGNSRPIERSCYETFFDSLNVVGKLFTWRKLTFDPLSEPSANKFFIRNPLIRPEFPPKFVHVSKTTFDPLWISSTTFIFYSRIEKLAGGPSVSFVMWILFWTDIVDQKSLPLSKRKWIKKYASQFRIRVNGPLTWKWIKVLVHNEENDVISSKILWFHQLQFNFSSSLIKSIIVWRFRPLTWWSHAIQILLNLSKIARKFYNAYCSFWGQKINI